MKRASRTKLGAARSVAVIVSVAGCLVFAGSAHGQAAGEILTGYVKDVASDVFQCGKGTSPCNLSYRLYHVSAGAEMNRGPGVDGIPLFRKRGHYQSDATQSGNFPSVRGIYGVPFFLAWDGVQNPGSPSHVGYYGVQSQILNAGEGGDSSQTDCSNRQGTHACFEPLTSANAQFLRGGLRGIGGLSPIPVPQVTRNDESGVSLDWDEAQGYTVTDGAPPGVVGYQLFAYPGTNPSDGALASRGVPVQVLSTSETRFDLPADHPVLQGAEQFTFALKLIYIGDQVSKYFSANSEPVTPGAGEEDDDGTDDDDDGVPDRDDNCPDMFNPDQYDGDGDGSGDDCDATPDGEDERDDLDEDAPPEPDDTGGETEPERSDEIDPDAAATPAQGAEGESTAPGVQGTTGEASTGPTALAGGAAALDLLDDADGLPSAVDNCAGVYNPLQADADGDGRGDACDPDADGDAVLDDRDCAVDDPSASLPVAEDTGTPMLAFAHREGTRLIWQAQRASTYQVLRGTLPLPADGMLSHACFRSGLTGGRLLDDEPMEGAGRYYLLAAESGCGAARPGRASDGRWRPTGEPCLRASVRPEGDAGEEIWRLVALGGPGRELELVVYLEPPPTLQNVHAVSFDLVFEPGSITLDGSPRPGSLLADAAAPARMDFNDSAAVSGRITMTVSRTGWTPRQSGAGPDALLRTRWRVARDGGIPVWLENVRALDSSYAPLELPPPPGWFRLVVHTPPGATAVADAQTP